MDGITLIETMAIGAYSGYKASKTLGNIRSKYSLASERLKTATSPKRIGQYKSMMRTAKIDAAKYYGGEVSSAIFEPGIDRLKNFARDLFFE